MVARFLPEIVIYIPRTDDMRGIVYAHDPADVPGAIADFRLKLSAVAEADGEAEPEHRIAVEFAKIPYPVIVKSGA